MSEQDPRFASQRNTVAPECSEEKLGGTEPDHGHGATAEAHGNGTARSSEGGMTERTTGLGETPRDGATYYSSDDDDGDRDDAFYSSREGGTSARYMTMPYAPSPLSSRAGPYSSGPSLPICSSPLAGGSAAAAAAAAGPVSEAYHISVEQASPSRASDPTASVATTSVTTGPGGGYSAHGVGYSADSEGYGTGSLDAGGYGGDGSGGGVGIAGVGIGVGSGPGAGPGQELGGVAVRSGPHMVGSVLGDGGYWHDTTGGDPGAEGADWSAYGYPESGYGEEDPDAAIGFGEEAPGAADAPVSEADVQDIFSLARHNRAKDVTALLERGVPPNVRDIHGNTILAIACQNGLKRIAKCALRKGADINGANYNGNTPLHFCYIFGYGDTLGEYLVSKGADPYARNRDGLTPSECARQ